MLRLSVSDPDFENRFSELLNLKQEISDEVDNVVRDIIKDVAVRGDGALIDYTSRFDGLDLTSETLAIPKEEIDKALKACDPKALKALEFASERITAYHQAQKPADYSVTQDHVTSGWRWTPVDAAGLYVPGGTASYPSSVLMNAIPARVAGVQRLVMVVPTPHGVLNPLVLAAAHLAGIDEIYRIGGAQAIAALAYGTQTIKPVHKIVGPGNAYVAAAKRRVFGKVGIDMVAGPSEVLILADEFANPEWLAIDLLAQAEHDKAAQSILITNSSLLAEQVEQAVEKTLVTLPRRSIAEHSWHQNGAIIVVDTLQDAVPLANRIATEHLEIETRHPELLASQIVHAGAIFLGSYTPEAIGDYVGGPNHVLPTARSAHYASGLSVMDFLKRTSILKCSKESLSVLGPHAMVLARCEGLEAHARSIDIRLNRDFHAAQG